MNPWAATDAVVYGSAEITGSTIKFSGTRLPDNNKENAGTSWINNAFDWGYADNFSLIDRLAAADPVNNPHVPDHIFSWTISDGLD